MRQGDPDWQLDQAGEADPNLTLRQAIDRAAERLEGRFRDQPRVEADVRLALGNAYLGLGLFDPAVPQFRRAVALQREHLGPTALETLDAISSLARSLAWADRMEEALTLYREVLDARERIQGPNHPDTLRALEFLANVHIALGQAPPAEKLLLRNLDAVRTVYGPDHVRVAKAQWLLGSLYTGRDNKRAWPYLQDALAGMRKAYPDPHPDLFDALLAVGYCGFRDGRYDDAEPYVREAIDGMRKYYRAGHPKTLRVVKLLGQVGIQRGVAGLARGDRAGGVRSIETAFSEVRRNAGDRHYSTLLMLHWAAGALVRYRQTETAEALSRDLLVALERNPQDDWQFHHARAVLGWVLLSQKRDQEAEPLLVGGTKGLIRLQATISPRYVFGSTVPEALRWAGEFHTRQGKPGEAVPLIDECLRLTTDMRVDPAAVAGVLIQRLRCCQRAADPAGCRATAEMFEKLDRADAGHLYDAACVRAVAASVYAGKNQPAEATADADRAMAWLGKAVAAGWSKRAHTETDADLVFLRGRADFRKLLASLPYPAPPPREVKR
ncbi:MAG: hypothetical protein C0501_08490 [Isosphaera sp.]|nr:hypothetical protein [Isosphaera sp.]